MKCHVDAIQWGGGVVAEFFRDLQRPMRFSGGGGVLAENFRDLKKPMRFSGGGGVVAQNFFFRYLQTSVSVNGALLHFFTFPKGGAGPPGPPLNRPTG